MNTKKASLFSAVLLSTTSMVGSGWLFSAQLTAKSAGNWAFLAWTLAALLVVAVGLCLSRVVATYPVRGVTTRSSALSHNNIFGIPFAFANWFGIVVIIATEAQATTQYLSAAIGSKLLIDNYTLTYAGRLLAIVVLFLYLLINFYGIRVLARVNNVVTMLKVFTPLLTITILLIIVFSQNRVTQNFTLDSNVVFSPMSAFTAVIGAGLIYSFSGFQVIASYASEIKNAERNVPLSMMLSIFIVLFIYLGLQYVFMAAVPNSMLIEHGGWQGMHLSSPLLNLAMILGLNFLAVLLLADSVISPSGSGYAYLGAASRMLDAMATEGQMPRWIAKLCPKYNFSRRSIVINWILAAIILFCAESWATLMIVVTGYNIIGYMAAPISMGAIEPKTRYVGMIVFVILVFVMLTISSSSLMIINVSLTILLAVYGFIQYKIGINMKKIIFFVSPFLIYLWTLYCLRNVILALIVSAVFYLLITCSSYVAFCKTHQGYKK